MSDDMGKVMAELRLAAREGRMISHACARVIGALYQGGTTSASFASTGYIPQDTDDLYRELFRGCERSTHQLLIEEAMARYLSEHGPRSRVEGWANLWL